MVPFDVVIGRDDMVCNSGGVTMRCRLFVTFVTAVCFIFLLKLK